MREKQRTALLFAMFIILTQCELNLYLLQRKMNCSKPTGVTKATTLVRFTATSHGKVTKNKQPYWKSNSVVPVQQNNC